MFGRRLLFSNAYLMTLQLSFFASVTSLCLWQGGVSGLQVIDFVVISFEVQSILDLPGLIKENFWCLVGVLTFWMIVLLPEK